MGGARGSQPSHSAALFDAPAASHAQASPLSADVTPSWRSPEDMDEDIDEFAKTV